MKSTRQDSVDTHSRGVNSHFGGLYVGRMKELQIHLISNKGSDSKQPTL